MPQIESVQLALFFKDSIPNADEIAKQLFDEELAQYGRVNPVTTVAMVPVGDNIVHVQVSPGRVDLVVNSSVTGTLNNVKIAVDFISGRIERLKLTNSPWRIALIVNAFDIAKNLQEAIELGRQQLTDAVLPPSGADFDIKINVPNQSKVQKGLTINRLYQLRPLGVMNLLLTADAIQANISTSQSPTEMRLVHQLDVNTDADDKLTDGNLLPVLDELVGIASFLIDKGYQGLMQ